MEQIEIDLKEYQRLLSKGIEVKDRWGQKYIIIGDVCFRASVTSENIEEGLTYDQI